MRCVQRGLQRRRVGFRAERFDHFAGSRDECDAGFVLCAEQPAFQTERRVVLPELHSGAVFALEALDLGLHRVERQGAFDALREHQAHLDQVERRWQDVCGDVLGDERSGGGIAGLLRAPQRHPADDGGRRHRRGREGCQHGAQPQAAAGRCFGFGLGQDRHLGKFRWVETKEARATEVDSGFARSCGPYRPGGGRA